MPVIADERKSLNCNDTLRWFHKPLADSLWIRVLVPIVFTVIVCTIVACLYRYWTRYQVRRLLSTPRCSVLLRPVTVSTRCYQISERERFETALRVVAVENTTRYNRNPSDSSCNAEIERFSEMSTCCQSSAPNAPLDDGLNETNMNRNFEESSMPVAIAPRLVVASACARFVDNANAAADQKLTRLDTCTFSDNEPALFSFRSLQRLFTDRLRISLYHLQADDTVITMPNVDNHPEEAAARERRDGQRGDAQRVKCRLPATTRWYSRSKLLAAIATMIFTKLWRKKEASDHDHVPTVLLAKACISPYYQVKCRPQIEDSDSQLCLDID